MFSNQIWKEFRLSEAILKSITRWLYHCKQQVNNVINQNNQFWAWVQGEENQNCYCLIVSYGLEKISLQSTGVMCRVYSNP